MPGPKTPAPLANAMLGLSQLSFAHSQPPNLLYQTISPWSSNHNQEQHQMVPSSSPLCWGCPAWPQHSREKGVCCCSPPRFTKTPLVYLAVCQCVTLVVSPMMRIDVTHQACCLSWYKPHWVSVKCREEFLNCLMPQGHRSTLRGQEHGKATHSWCNQLEKMQKG